jgi:tetratricopeptide (TPR) repeat protein
MRKELFPNGHREVADSLGNMGFLMSKRRRFSEAETFFIEEIELRKKLSLLDEPDTATAFLNLAAVLGNQHREREAQAAANQAVAIGQKAWTNMPVRLAGAITMLAAHWQAENNYEEAERLMLQANEIVQKSALATAVQKRQQIGTLCEFYSHWAIAAPGTGKMQKLLEWQKRLTDFERSSRQKTDRKSGDRP